MLDTSVQATTAYAQASLKTGHLPCGKITSQGLPKYCRRWIDHKGDKHIRFKKGTYSIYLTGVLYSEEFNAQYAAALQKGAEPKFRKRQKLTIKKIEKLTIKGKYLDERGLYLKVDSPTNRTWIYRYTQFGERHEMDLGSAESVSLDEARELRRKARRQVDRYLDPKQNLSIEQQLEQMRYRCATLQRQLANAEPTPAKKRWRKPRPQSTIRQVYRLYRHYDANGILLYVGKSISAISRQAKHAKTAHWSDQITKVTFEQYSSAEELAKAEIKAIKSERPKHNIVHNKA